MANHKSAEKCIRKIAARTAVNKSRKSRVRTYVKKFLLEIASGNKDGAESAFIKAQSELARAASKGVFNKKMVSRKTGRLSAKLAAM